MPKPKIVKSMPSGLSCKERYIWLRDNGYCPSCCEKQDIDYQYVYCTLCRKYQSINKKIKNRYFSRKIENGMI